MNLLKIWHAKHTVGSFPKLDPHLEPLIKDSKRSNQKLLAAWDGLSIETQIRILHVINENINIELFKKCLESANDYIRYLAASNIKAYRYNLITGSTKNDINGLIDNLISNDHSELVKFAYTENINSSGLRIKGLLNEDGKFIDFDYESFFLTAQIEQLSVVAGLAKSANIYYEDFIKLIKWGLNNSALIDIQWLEELVHEYIVNLDDEKWDEDWHPSGLRNLWSAIPELPYRLQFILITELPSIDAVLTSGWSYPKEFLDYLFELLPKNSNIVENFLYRKDVVAKKFRKKVYFSELSNSSLKYAAARHHIKVKYHGTAEANPAAFEAQRLLNEYREKPKRIQHEDSLAWIHGNAPKRTYSLEEKINLLGIKVDEINNTINSSIIHILLLIILILLMVIGYKIL